MSYQIKNGSTAYPLVFMMVDSTDHVTGKTGLSPTVTISKAGAAFASPSGAVTEIGSGWYKVAGNATDSNTNGPLILHATATGADPTDTLYEVVAFDPQDAVRQGLTALPNVASGSAGAIVTSGTGTAQISLSSGLVTLAGVTHTGAVIPTVTTLTNLPSITAGWLTATGIASGALNGKGDWNIGKTGYSLTQSFPTNFSSLAITVGGGVTVATNGDKTGYSLTQAFPSNFSSMSITAGGLVDITQTAADKVWGTTTRLLTAGTNIALAKGTGITGFNDLDASGVATAVWNAATASYGSAGSYGLLIETNLDAQVSSVGGGSLTTADIADAVWDEALSWHATSGSAGAALTGAGSAGDPWSTLLPGAYGAGTAGKIVGDNLDAAISSRATQTSVDTIDDYIDTEVAAIKTKTDFLPSATAGAAGGLFIAGSNAATTVNITGNITGNLSGSVGSVSGHTPQTGDSYARLGAPAGVSVSADIAAIQSDTNDIQTRVPAALVGGRMDSNLSAIGNSTATMAAFNRAVKSNAIGTVAASSTTTVIKTSLVTPSPSVADQLKGRIVIFADDTTTAALRGQATDITASSASATPDLTVTALTTAPASGDVFVIV